MRLLSSSDVRTLLREGEVQFVVADIGLKPRWIPLKDCYGFWMNEVQHRLIEPDAKLSPAQLPGVYCYRASEWQSDEIAAHIIVLELCH